MIRGSLDARPLHAVVMPRYTADDLPPINELYQRKLVGDFRGGVIYLKPHSRGVAYDIDPFDLQ